MGLRVTSRSTGRKNRLPTTAAVHWMGIGLPLDVLKIFTYSDDSATEARQLFADLKNKYIAPNPTSKYEYDVFVSYSRDDEDVFPRPPGRGAGLTGLPACEPSEVMP